MGFDSVISLITIWLSNLVGLVIFFMAGFGGKEMLYSPPIIIIFVLVPCLIIFVIPKFVVFVVNTLLKILGKDSNVLTLLPLKKHLFLVGAPIFYCLVVFFIIHPIIVKIIEMQIEQKSNAYVKNVYKIENVDAYLSDSHLQVKPNLQGSLPGKYKLKMSFDTIGEYYYRPVAEKFGIDGSCIITREYTFELPSKNEFAISLSPQEIFKCLHKNKLTENNEVIVSSGEIVFELEYLYEGRFIHASETRNILSGLLNEYRVSSSKATLKDLNGNVLEVKFPF